VPPQRDHIVNAPCDRVICLSSRRVGHHKQCVSNTGLSLILVSPSLNALVSLRSLHRFGEKAPDFNRGDESP